MIFREGSPGDLDILAEMNKAMIRDSGHKNLAELRERMAGWLQGEYKAFIFSVDGDDVGYVLYRHDPEWVYLRQFYVRPEKRRQGFGLQAVEWLKRAQWKSCAEK